MIEIHELAKSYGEVQAVRGVSFKAADGRITALLGPNGAGKSTTLRILSTVSAPDGGSARVDGVDVMEDPMKVRQSIGVLPHNSGLYARLTGIENVRYFGRLQGIAPSDLETRIEALVGRGLGGARRVATVDEDEGVGGERDAGRRQGGGERQAGESGDPSHLQGSPSGCRSE